MLFAILHPIVYKYCALPRKSDARSYECFAPRPRTLFQHLNFQKCSDNSVRLTFWLRNALRTTAACNFWYLAGPDGRFSEPAPRPSGATKHWKKTYCFATFTFSRTFIFFLLPLFSDFPSLIFFLLTISSLTLSLLWLFSQLLLHLSISRKFDF